MTDLSTDSAYLRYQYADSERLRIRQDAHRLYSETPDDFFPWILDRLEPRAGDLVADIGCGPGAYHPLLAERGVRILGVDASPGMVADVRRQAVERELPVWAVQASAETVPLADVCCERLMANHMLYHVPDQEAALREMRRVVKPGGRIVLAANALDSNRRLADLHAQAARELGYTPQENHVQLRFSLADLDRVQGVFPGARVDVREDAFLFPTADAALRYYASMMVDMIEEETDGGHRPPLLAHVADKIQSIVTVEGHFRVPKSAGCFVADV